MTTYTQEQCVKDDVLLIQRNSSETNPRQVVVSFDDGTSKTFTMTGQGMSYGPLEASVAVTTKSPVTLACLPSQHGFPIVEALIALMIALPLWLVVIKRYL